MWVERVMLKTPTTYLAGKAGSLALDKVLEAKNPSQPTIDTTPAPVPNSAPAPDSSSKHLPLWLLLLAVIGVGGVVGWIQWQNRKPRPPSEAMSSVTLRDDGRTGSALGHEVRIDDPDLGS